MHPEEKSERRFTDRYKIPDGFVYFKQLKRLNWISQYQGPFVLNDIASNSASFDTPRHLNMKQHIEMKIVASRSQEEIKVKGEITRKDIKDSEGVHRYVVQFSPYGEGEQYNSFKNKEKLRAFIKSVKGEKKS